MECTCVGLLSYTLRYLWTSEGRYSLSKRKWSLTILSVKRERQWEVGWSDAAPDPTPTREAGLASRCFCRGGSSVWLYMTTEKITAVTLDYMQTVVICRHHLNKDYHCLIFSGNQGDLWGFRDHVCCKMSHWVDLSRILPWVDASLMDKYHSV